MSSVLSGRKEGGLVGWRDAYKVRREKTGVEAVKLRLSSHGIMIALLTLKIKCSIIFLMIMADIQ